MSHAQVTITVYDPGGSILTAIPAVSDSVGVYRSDAWAIPLRMPEGTGTVILEAKAGCAQRDGAASFKVKAPTREVLLNKYGFWLDAPGLKGIVPQLVAQKDDARNGLIRCGGFVPAQHVQPENWVEVYWREGNYHLENGEAVKQFMRKEWYTGQEG
ncbi:MAG: hypothetical protein LUQ45_04115 [Methanoregulaceae archaeon]|nr:hypothetical protein [Methanoregulaceae archaeon]